MLHIITPFTRLEFKDFYIKNYSTKNIIWHPITPDKFLFESDIKNYSWIQPYIVNHLSNETFGIIKINDFIKNYPIINEDRYCFIFDDDWMEENLVDKINKYDNPVLFISMKRGEVIPNGIGHGVSTLFPFEGVKAGGIGFQQIFVKGFILKQMEFLSDPTDIRYEMPDGYMAEWLQENFEVKYVTDIYTYFNYLEPGRWIKNKLEINMETIAQRFERVKKESRDISGHLDTLLQYAQECDTIVELGVNEGISTTAFLMAKKKFTNCDVHITKMFQELIDMTKAENVDMNFILSDDLIIEIPECDLLFIDTNHIYKQLKSELVLHGNKAKKYIIMHDTETFGDVSLDKTLPGMKQAVNEFLIDNPHWKIKEHFIHCNGLTVLQRDGGFSEQKIIKENKKYLLTTPAFMNNDLLKICVMSWPVIPNKIEKLVFFDGTKWKSIFNNLIENDNIKKYVDVCLTENRHIGVSGSWNKILEYGFERNNFNAVIFVGSDTEMTENFFEQLIKDYEDSGADFATCMGYNCFIINKKCYDTVGKFDENLFPCYFEDNDYDHRVRKSSNLLYKIVGDESKLKHYGSAVIRLNNECNTANGITFSMNREYYIKKWGGNPTEEKFESPYNDSKNSLKDWIFDLEFYEKKAKIWNK